MSKVLASYREIGPLLVIAGMLAFVYSAFFGQYAFDDSFFGYSIAQSLIAGRGFSFNGGDHVLSTSAPLAVYIYAFVTLLFKVTVVQAAQIGSALSYAVIAFGSYTLLRRFSSRFGALIGTLIFMCTPFTLPLWSHETLLYIATTIVGLILYIGDRRVASAFVLGCATLFRGEALLLLPFVWLAEFRLRGSRAALGFAVLSLSPCAAWTAGAWFYFGAPFSETIASKHAQIYYPMVTPYLDGVRDYVVRGYALTPDYIWADILEATLALSIASALVCRTMKRAHFAVAVWIAATTALYVLLQLPFYFWFCSQLAVAMAVGAAIVWPKTDGGRLLGVLAIGRGASLIILLLNLSYAVTHLEPAQKYSGYDWVIMPALKGNAYSALAQWFRETGHTRGAVAYNEFGQLHYYSHLPIVDYLGIVTPGAAARLLDGDAIWTFKQYRPQYVVASADLVRVPATNGATLLPNFDYVVAPAEYDWFNVAYSSIALLHFRGDPRRSDFRIYELTSPSAIPAADNRDSGLRVRRITHMAKSVSFEFQPSHAGAVEIEARLQLPSACHVLHERIAGGAELQVAERVVTRRILRVTMQLKRPLSAGTYRWSISGCAHIAVAPPLLMRHGFIWWGKPPAVRGTAFDAMTVYSRT